MFLRVSNRGFNLLNQFLIPLRRLTMMRMVFILKRFD